MLNSAFKQKNIELGRRCLALIRDIADRGASSWDPEMAGYLLQELRQVLLERLGCEDAKFPPVSAGLLTELACLYEQLLWAHDLSRDMSRPQ
jgi:hypothetical protein